MELSLALLEYGSLATGVLAVDRLLKRSPVALLRCGTVHPGRWLALVGGSVAATEEAHAEGVAVGREAGALLDEVWLPDPHAALAAALEGGRRAPQGEALGVLETATSPALLAALDAALKAVPVALVELRLADDLGGRAVAFLDGSLTEVEAALETATAVATGRGTAAGTSLIPRLDDTLRRVLAAGTRFAACAAWRPEGAEVVGCSSDG